MQRIQSLSNSDTLPAPRTFTQNPGFFQPGNLAVGKLPTQVTSEWCNSVQEEIARAEEIERFAGSTNSRDFIEQTAKEKLGLLYANEIVFKKEK